MFAEVGLVLKAWKGVEMNQSFRKAAVTDVPRLWELRRESILELAPLGMPTAHAEAWASTLTIEGMEHRFLDAEIWVAETGDTVTGWIAIRGDYIDGLYINPRYARQNVGTELLRLAEGLMKERGIPVIRLEASVNAAQFYLRRGFAPTSIPAPDEAIPMEKRL
jgi:putative acetyltransferase